MNAPTHGGFVVNPRRAPRAPARCRASVQSAAGAFVVDTEDVGAHGCQLVGARAVRSGERVELEISNELVTGALRLTGRIAWAGEVEPWRLGVAFEESGLPRARDWFERLVASHPGVGAFRRVPDRIPLDAPVFLGPPPDPTADFSREEVGLLRRVGDGVAVHEILADVGARWPRVQRSFFSLLSRQHLTLLTRLAVPASSWAEVLDRAERSLRGEPKLDEGERALPEPPPAELRPPPPARPILGTQHASPGAAAEPPRHAPDLVGAGVGWRAAVSRPRPAEAQRCLEAARAEVDAGRLNDALALLRRALSLAPGDAEIAGALGQLAFRGRSTSGR